ncbi:MAG: hypothetical protein ACYDC1_12785 [Limisphaerales bacterium]
MSQVFIRGWGAVSPAGWGVTALREALDRGTPLPVTPLPGPGSGEPFSVRPVPPPVTRPAALSHPRLRRASPIGQHVVAAGWEALGADLDRVPRGEVKLGVIVAVMTGCVNYSRRFYDETLRDPATASPMVFPETVFNAPASHLAASLGTKLESTTIVGDDGSFLQGVALAADWLSRGKVDGCLVVGAEEVDWLVAGAMRFFHCAPVLAGGAGALYLRSEPGDPCGPVLDAITDAFTFTSGETRRQAALNMRRQLGSAGDPGLLVDGTIGVAASDAAEVGAWVDWTGTRLAPKAVFGEAFPASAAWHCVVACDALHRGVTTVATVSVVGANQQAIGTRFVRCQP